MNLRWIDGMDQPNDLCAHGDVRFQVETTELVSPEDNGQDLNISATALHLLRTLSTPHTQSEPICSQLFPHCGHFLVDEPNREDVLIVGGCPAGVDFEVLHRRSPTQLDEDSIVIRSDDNLEWCVDWREWRTAVFHFADTITDFYAASSPKRPNTQLAAKGFQKFQEEWKRRREKELVR